MSKLMIGTNRQVLLIGLLLILGVYLLAYAYLLEIEIQDFSYPPQEPMPSPTEVTALLREADEIAKEAKASDNSQTSEMGKERP